MEMVEGEPPYLDLDPEEALKKILEEGIPGLYNQDNYTVELVDFFELCCDVDASKRPTAQDMLHHPFMLVSCEAADLVVLCEEATKIKLEREQFLKL